MSTNGTTWVFEGKDGGIFDLLNKLDEKMNTVFNDSKLGKFFDSVAAGALKFDAVEQAIEKVDQLLEKMIGKPLELANNFERLKVSFDTMTGSKEVGDNLADNLRELGDKTTIGAESAEQAGRHLLAMGTAAQDVIPVVKELGDISAGSGIPLQNLSETFARAKETGYVMSRQIAEIPGAMEVLRQATGATGIQLRKEFASGQIGVKAFEHALQVMTSQGGRYYNELAKDAETTGGKTQIIHQRLENSLMKVGEAMQPAISRIADSFSNFLDTHEAGIEKFVNLVGKAFTAVEPVVVGVLHIVGGAISGVINGMDWVANHGKIIKEVLIDVGIAVGALTLAWAASNVQLILWNIGVGVANASMMVLAGVEGIVTAAQWLLNIAMDANPIGLIILAIGALVIAFIEAYKHSETFRAILSGIGAVAKELGGVFIGLGKTIIGAFTLNPKMFISGMEDMAHSALNMHSLSGVFNKAYDESIADSHAREAATHSSQPKLPGAKDGFGKGASSAGSEKSSGISDVSAGGAKVRNVTVNISKLVEKIEVHSSGVKEGMANIKQQIEEAFVQMVRDGELVLGNE